MTLTLGIAYLTILSHERTRAAQGANLRTQSSLLNTLLLADPTLAHPDYDAETSRTSRASLVETAKDRWNDEIQNAVRWVQGAGWEGVREGMEGGVARLLGTGLEKGREEVARAEEKGGVIAREAMQKSREVARESVDGTRAAADRRAARTLAKVAEGGEAVEEGKTEHGLENASAVAKEIWKEGVAKGAQVAEGLIITEESAVGAVKDAVTKGVAKAKQVAGAATQRAKKRDEADDGLTDVQRALRQRYQKSEAPNETVQKALAERYRPIDTNTVLRGV